jgi:hypothetical protein
MKNPETITVVPHVKRKTNTSGGESDSSCWLGTHIDYITTEATHPQYPFRHDFYLTQRKREDQTGGE